MVRRRGGEKIVEMIQERQRPSLGVGEGVWMEKEVRTDCQAEHRVPKPQVLP